MEGLLFFYACESRDGSLDGRGVIEGERGELRQAGKEEKKESKKEG